MTINPTPLTKEQNKLEEKLWNLVDKYFPKLKTNGNNKGRGEAMVIVAVALEGIKNIEAQAIKQERSRTVGIMQAEKRGEHVCENISNTGDCIDCVIDDLLEALKEI